MQLDRGGGRRTRWRRSSHEAQDALGAGKVGRRGEEDKRWNVEEECTRGDRVGAFARLLARHAAAGAAADRDVASRLNG